MTKVDECNRKTKKWLQNYFISAQNTPSKYGVLEVLMRLFFINVVKMTAHYDCSFLLNDRIAIKCSMKPWQYCICVDVILL